METRREVPTYTHQDTHTQTQVDPVANCSLITCVCMCVCVREGFLFLWRGRATRALASEISAVVQDGLHPANISERDGTFLGQEALPGGRKGKSTARKHTLSEGRMGVLGLRRVNRKRLPVLAEPR